LATKADVMILDKTGTLTTGEFKVLNAETVSKIYGTNEILALMAGIEGGSSHPIAQSIVGYAENKGVKPINFDSINVVSGAGVEGEANGHRYELISQKAFGQNIEFDVPKGATVSYLVEE